MIDATMTAYLDGQVLSKCHKNIASTTASKASILDQDLIHHRMCHLGGDHVEQLIHEKLSADLKLTSSTPMSDLCESCVSGKQHRHPFPKSAEHAPGVLDHIFSDVYGPMPVRSHNGCLYWATFIDDASQWMEAYELAKKSDLFAAFSQFKALVEKQTGRNIKCFHNDEGGEFKLKALIEFCKEEGICIE